MNKFVTSLVIAVAACVGSVSVGLGGSFANTPKNSGVPSIPLTTTNLVVLSSEINSVSVSKVMEEMALIRTNEIYLYIKSPGGSVIDGAKLVDAILSTNKKVNCIVDFAASMAFVLLQACDTRLVMRTSILMQHEASFGIPNQPQPNAESFRRFIEGIITDFDIMQAKRIGITLMELRFNKRNDWWTYGAAAVSNNTADKLVNAICTIELYKTDRLETVETLFGKVEVTWSGCPLLDEPKSVKVPGDVTHNQMQELIKSLNLKDKFLTQYGVK